LDDAPRFGHEQVAALLAKQWDNRRYGSGLVMARIELFGRQFRRGWSLICVASPKNRSQTAAVGTAKIPD